MKKIKFGGVLIKMAIILFLAENFFFGWNLTPQSSLEIAADGVVSSLFTIGFIIYLIPLWKIYEDKVEENE